MFRSTLTKSIVSIAALSALAAVAPTAASAATVTNSNGVVTYSAGSGQTNDLRVTLTSSYVQFQENNNDQPTSARGCARYDWGVRCAVRNPLVRVHAGNMHDRVVAQLDGSGGVSVYGGPDNDYLDLMGNYASRGFLYGEDGHDQLYGRQFGDTAWGGAGNDILGLGTGNDTAIGGPGSDRIDTGSGNDHVYAKDSTRDLVACGLGTDWAQVDRSYWWNRDDVRGCERVVS